MRRIAIFMIVVSCTLAGACTGPSRWSEKTFAQLQCGMTEEAVATLTEDRLDKLSGTSADGTTHIVHHRTTYIRMAMPSGRLQSADLCWDYGLKVIACAQIPRLRCSKA
jgi:hypothetical protein